MSELQARYGHLALFFADGVAGSRIGIVWKPAAFLPKPFRLSAAKDAMPVGGGRLVIPNIFAMVADISGLGKGLVVNVAMQ